MGRLTFDAVVKALRLRKSSLSSSQDDNAQPRSNRSLERELRGWQIFMILISGIIGVTIFATNGEFLRTAGPAGLMTAIAYVGINAIFVMEGLSELIVLWPVSNAMVEYVRTFVDEDLALVVGLTYWYSWSSVVATMFVVAANFATYWDLPTFWQTSAFYIFGPIVILGINWIGVKWYGWVEGVLGIFKLFFVIAGALFLFITGSHNGSKFINAGYHADKDVTSNQTAAVLLVIPYLTYGFLGVEIVTVAAFEARKPRKSLRSSARWIAYVITLLFVLCGIGEALNVAWYDSRLPEMGEKAKIKTRDDSQQRASFSVLVLAARINGHLHAAGCWNAFLIVSCLSAANTALYVASRTLYGLCRELPQNEKSRLKRWPSKLGALDPRTRVPFWALLASTVVFFWLPFLHLKSGYSVQSLLEVMITIGSVGCVLVWASQCLAYIRYFNWLRAHKPDLDQLKEEDSRTYNRYDRENTKKKERFHSLLGPTQPAPAYLGLLMCFLTTFVFSSATWWKNEATVKKVAVAYAGPLACLLLWLALKAHRYHQSGGLPAFYTDLSHNPRRFQEIINGYEGLLYLRDEDADADDDYEMRPQRVGTPQVIANDYRQGPGQHTMMNGAPPEHGFGSGAGAMQRRTAGGIVGVGGGAGAGTNQEMTTELPAPVIRPDDIPVHVRGDVHAR